MKMNTSAHAPKTKPKQTQSNPISKGNPWLIPSTRVPARNVNFCRILSNFYVLLHDFVEFLQIFTPFSPYLFYPNSITPPPKPPFQLKKQRAAISTKQDCGLVLKIFTQLFTFFFFLRSFGHCLRFNCGRGGSRSFFLAGMTLTMCNFRQAKQGLFLGPALFFFQFFNPLRPR
jgi:hypothetical protein